MAVKVMGKMIFAALVVIVCAFGAGVHAQFYCYDLDLTCYSGLPGECSPFSCPSTVFFAALPYTPGNGPLVPGTSCAFSPGTCLKDDCVGGDCNIATKASDWVLNVFSEAITTDLSCSAVCGALGKTCNEAGTQQLSSPNAINSLFDDSFSPIMCGGSFSPFSAPGLSVSGCLFISVDPYSCDYNPVDAGASPTTFLPACCCGMDCPVGAGFAGPVFGDIDMSGFAATRMQVEETMTNSWAPVDLRNFLKSDSGSA